MKTLITLVVAGMMVGDVPPSARSYIAEQVVVPIHEYKQKRSEYENWTGCSTVIDVPLENGYRHLVCVRTLISE